ncbi:flagellar motor protein MotB [Bacillus horti]|uniref:Chemotaxis protein MotB n=1 Tax=Caldalkalibacillus horti TaxID=77523 RepID=A0ABT9W5T2_9BACI|nr:flagellar motor protein MotB [Bacillus horti]MDQ0168437.1 chemotaxis protein MotB [Bacillus horti]
MSKRKKQKHHEEHIDESWLIPYADILTLLLALFIVLFASSSVDATKFEQLSRSLNQALSGGTGVMQYQNPVPGTTPSEIPSRDYADVNTEEHEDEFQRLLDTFADENDLRALIELQRRINAYIQDKDLALSLQTELTREGLLITILDNALYSSGSATVRPDAVTLAREISGLLVTDPPRRIEISGHTDNVPIGRASAFRSNWDLSAMRAVNFLEILLENEDLDPRKFTAAGYGEYNPVATNDTDEGKSKNRRVEVLILPYEVETD